MTNRKVAILPGDGIGPEVTAQSVKILSFLARAGVGFEIEFADVGGGAYDRHGHPLPPKTFDLAKDADAILFGAEGGFQYETLPRGLRPGDALLTLRRELGLYANYRPIRSYPELAEASPFKPEIVAGVDLLILRELNSDIYFGEPRGERRDAAGKREAFNTMYYHEDEIRRIIRLGFEEAAKRRGRLCSVDKANVLETMELWRDIACDVASSYPSVALTHLYVDAAAMALVRQPASFDVVVTTNLFGDILSDEASMLSGSIGLLPSASLNESGKGLYEPVHGCAPDIAGKDIANPLGSILSTAMMLRQAFGLEQEAESLDMAVRSVLSQGYRTAEFNSQAEHRVGTEQMGDLVLQSFKNLLS
ncbi:MAG: 3-isopropylmalate dehydrogenase [Stutzerimonas stutzeri]|jgi:3-isopropylmalate dehydrogenase|nr:MAG: 3-isopropylmalate dehydrogenase [Stutzerimonas stutzeri]